MQEAPETCRVVKKCSIKGHCPAASCWFIKSFIGVSLVVYLPLHFAHMFKNVYSEITLCSKDSEISCIKNYKEPGCFHIESFLVIQFSWNENAIYSVAPDHSVDLCDL